MSEELPGQPQMPGRSWRAGKAITAMERPQALIAPLERGLGGLRQAGPGICGSKYMEDVKAARSVRVWSSCITKRKSPTEWLPGHHQMPGRSWRAGKATAAMESPQALIAPLERGSGGFNKSSSDDRPGPGICDSKYVEDAKAARSVRVWDRVPIRKESPQTNV